MVAARARRLRVRKRLGTINELRMSVISAGKKLFVLNTKTDSLVFEPRLTTIEPAPAQLNAIAANAPVPYTSWQIHANANAHAE